MKVAEVRRLLWASGLISGPQTPDPDVYRLAATLIAHCGEDAPAEASARADALLDRGDVDGWAIWRTVANTVGEFLTKECPAGTTLH